MIKELSADNAKVITNKLGETLSIEEKLDTTYFTMHFSQAGIEKIVNMNGVEIDFVDYTINAIYRDIINFCGSLYEKIKDVINGEYVIGFMYFPTSKPRYIEYPEHEGKFVFQHMWGIEDGEKVEYDYSKSCELIEQLKIGNIKCIKKLECTISDNIIQKTERYISGDTSSLMYMHELLKEFEVDARPKPKQLMKAEAYIIRVNDDVRKVTINKKETMNNMIQKKMVRDIVLKDFTNWFMDKGVLIESGHTYIGIVSELFLEYINDTDIFNKYSITKDDLTPPTFGSIGDLSYEFIDNKTVEAIIKNDENRRALFRMLLASLRKPITKKKGDMLSTQTVGAFNNIVETIKAMA